MLQCYKWYWYCLVVVFEVIIVGVCKIGQIWFNDGEGIFYGDVDGLFGILFGYGCVVDWVEEQCWY